MKKGYFRGTPSTLALLLGSVALATPAFAQETPAVQAETQDSSGGLADIIVTAQRRNESAQNVPIAVAAFSGDQLAKVGLASSADLVTVIPGLTINPTGARSPIFLRGVGNNGTSTSPSVLTFIDGVYQPFDSTGADYSNIQSIEVAKGPQGTLFGRNATGGVIQITTKNPFDWQGLDTQVGYANYNEFSARAYGAVKLSDKVAADLAGFFLNQNDGWGTNLTTGNDSYTARRWGVRGKLVFEADDTFKATLTGDYTYRRGQQGLGISPNTLNGFTFNAITGQTVSLPSTYDINSEFDPFYRSRESGAALKLEKDAGDVKLLSITSYRHLIEDIDIDFDGTEFEAIRLTRQDHRNAFTQELQASGGNETIKWVAGLYYYYMLSNINGPRFQGLFFPGGFAISSRDETNAYAAYAQGTAEILPNTNLTLGARYTIEKRQITGHTAAGGAVIPGSEGTEEATFKKPNFRVALDHKLTPNVLAYASWSRGFNAGFFNQISFGGFTEAANPVVKPEGIDAYEIGLKSDLLDRKLRVNIAAFLYDYSNLQQQIYSPGGIVSLNAASARIKGIDLDIVARPVRELTLSLSANYLDTHYRSYPQAPNYDYLSNGNFVAIGALDAAGKQLVSAPKFGLQASATYTLDTSIGTFDTTANVNYQTKQYSDPQNEFPIPGRTLIGLTEQWKSSDELTTVSLWVKNLTNRKYDLSFSLLENVGLIGNPGAPRTYGITLGRKF
ncbi:TonB-dependent receptor [Sphingobium sp.]|uniref:TonB-dependent receptor n=1 Tax=Sphingobium sp. TaxID=1912891 RepID=UPI0028BD3DE4|nr:TonB-dependent receptor [Sphingobium sp.]